MDPGTRVVLVVSVSVVVIFACAYWLGYMRGKLDGIRQSMDRLDEFRRHFIAARDAPPE
jgi:hypothetical protein